MVVVEHDIAEDSGVHPDIPVEFNPANVLGGVFAHIDDLRRCKSERGIGHEAGKQDDRRMHFDGSGERSSDTAVLDCKARRLV